MSENSDILVSAVIPAYNAEACIGRAIDSVLAQTLPVHEIIVVDDGSADGTGEVVKAFGDKVIYIRQENAGVSVARNTGIKAATGNWIAFLDADDEWLPEKNSKQFAVIKQNPDLRWCASNSQTSLNNVCSPLGNQRAISKEINSNNCFEDFFRAHIKGGCPTHTPTMIIRKDVFDEVEGFEPGRKRSQDLDVWWRIALRYPKIGYVAAPLVTVYLEAHDKKLVGYRMMEKTGSDIREVVAKCLLKSRQLGVESNFVPFASAELKRRLRTMLFNGFGKDAKDTLRDFSDLFPWHIRFGGSLLASFPKTTSAMMRTMSWIKHKAGLSKRVTRRYAQSDIEKHTDSEN